MQKLFNPVFLFQKRKAIWNRIKEIPMNFLWKIIYRFIERGYLYHPDYEELKKIKDMHTDKIGVLVGNGPSVKLKELERMKKDKNIISFGANRFYLCYDQTSFRPDYVLSSDQQMIDDFGNEIVDNNPNSKIFFASLSKPQHINNNFIWLKLIHGRPFKFSHDIKPSLMCSGGTLIAAIQLGYYMGIRKFYLYGVDHNFSYEKNQDNQNDAKGDGNHFIKNYRSGKAWQSPKMELVEEAFIKCDKIFRQENGFLKNATKGGKLEVLERINFEHVIHSRQNGEHNK